MKIENVQKMVCIDKTNKWFHASKFFQVVSHINHTRRWFHKWSSTLSDHQEKKVPTHTKAQAYQEGWPMHWHRGGAPLIGIKVKDPTWGISRVTSGVIQTYAVVSIKIARFKCQPSTPSATLCINKMHTFYGNWWQRGEISTKIGSWISSWT
jgi:hypothetical protein